MVTEVAVALEVAEDRRHTSVVVAGRLPHDQVLVDLIYLAGTDPIDTVVSIQDRQTVIRVVVDPHSHASTTIRGLEAAGVEVTKPVAGDLAEAHGLFLDILAAGRIRHRGQQELTAAMRYLEQRRLGGAAAAERRGALVDVAPAIAGELAVWGLLTAPPEVELWVSYG